LASLNHESPPLSPSSPLSPSASGSGPSSGGYASLLHVCLINYLITEDQQQLLSSLVSIASSLFEAQIPAVLLPMVSYILSLFRNTLITNEELNLLVDTCPSCFLRVRCLILSFCFLFQEWLILSQNEQVLALAQVCLGFFFAHESKFSFCVSLSAEGCFDARESSAGRRAERFQG
jgi:hypothetical protein